jgi:hypothetical protein
MSHFSACIHAWGSQIATYDDRQLLQIRVRTCTSKIIGQYNVYIRTMYLSVAVTKNDLSTITAHKTRMDALRVFL